jgi:hypothetical protein
MDTLQPVCDVGMRRTSVDKVMNLDCANSASQRASWPAEGTTVLARLHMIFAPARWENGNNLMVPCDRRWPTGLDLPI